MGTREGGRGRRRQVPLSGRRGGAEIWVRRRGRAPLSVMCFNISNSKLEG